MEWFARQRAGTHFSVQARGSNSVGRVTAFQAVGRGFEPRLPLNVVDVLSVIKYTVARFAVSERLRSSVGRALPW